jgi:hypothetical protein
MKTCQVFAAYDLDVPAEHAWERVAPTFIGRSPSLSTKNNRWR